MSEFKTLETQAQTDLIEKLGAILKDNDCGDVAISQSKELVFNASAQTYEENVSVSIKKDFPAAELEKCVKVMAEIITALGDVKGVNVEIVSKLGAGDPYETITKVEDCSKEGEVELAHIKGQVWLIDFWATWCPPCQAPMQHNVDMLAKRGEDWKDKVRIIGLSIDSEKESVNTHMKNKKWESVESFFRGKSECSKVYSVNGVPHVMIIDKEGKIAFKGHPANRPNLEQDLDDLAAGKALTGEGTGPAPKEEESDSAVPEGFSEMDKAQVYRELDDNKKVLEGFTKDESLKESAKDCPRAFCVIVF